MMYVSTESKDTTTNIWNVMKNEREACWKVVEKKTRDINSNEENVLLLLSSYHDITARRIGQN